MCRSYGREANSMVSVYSTLCRWTATSNFINAVKRQRNLGLRDTITPHFSITIKKNVSYPSPIIFSLIIHLDTYHNITLSIPNSRLKKKIHHQFIFMQKIYSGFLIAKCFIVKYRWKFPSRPYEKSLSYLRSWKSFSI